EAFLEAFAIVYLAAARSMRARAEGREPDEFESDYPTVVDGARGVHFITKTVESAADDRKWTEARWGG
ncbi:MAG: gfo/Idh/MocA family oxidoreductase, partial [Truepera sp.]|nr:gfo/Idh/MocA family oxidoreductase [Truepera sp.]